MHYTKKFFILMNLAIILFISACSEEKATKENTDNTRQENVPSFVKQAAGKWMRMDGGYVLNIHKFNTDNTLEADYLNPRQIHIAESQWKLQDGYLYLFIKFEDEGYPGSYYSLGYHPKEDRLLGFYYQAVIGQKFDVVFERR
jgi:hypothetical protein